MTAPPETAPSGTPASGRAAHRRAAVACATIAAGAILVATLTPMPGVVPPDSHWCLPCGETGTVDALDNVVLFTPLGIAMRALGLATPLAIALGAALSLAIELLQYLVIPGRHAAASDVLTNTLGTALGALLQATWRGWLRPAPRPAARLATAGMAAVVAVHGLSALGLTRSVPHVAYWAEWAPALTPDGVFLGEVTGFSLGGFELPYHKVRPSSALWPLLESDTARFRAAFVSGPTPARSAPIVRVAHPDFEMFALVQDGPHDLRMRVRTLAGVLRLRVPTIAIPGVLDTARQGRDTIRVEGGLARTALAAAWRRGEARGSAELPLTTSLGWALWLPFAIALGPWAVVVSAAWNAVLAFPVAWWGAHAVGGRRGALLAFGSCAVALATIPMLSGGARARPLEWIGAAVGAVASAWLASRFSARRA